MDHTTIAIRRDLKEKIATFGNKGETFSDVIERLYESAVKRQLHDLLMGEENTISIEEARKKLDKKWSRSK